MNSLKFSDFLFERIQETISYGQYIKEVNIDYALAENFGNEYIRTNYTVDVNESFDDLPFDVKQKLFNEKQHFVFPLSTHAELGQRSEKRKLFRILEFKHIYESLSTYASLQFEKALDPGVSIKIKGVDLWPAANYAEKYLNHALYLKFKKKLVGFEDDVLQWERLHHLASESKKKFHKGNFNITDSKINDLFGLRLDDIRYLLLRYEVPIKIKGVKTIDKVYIHALKLVEALNKYIQEEYFYGNKIPYQYLIKYLYDNHLHSEKLKLINTQKTNFLEYFVVQKGDILQLKDKRIVVTNSIEIDSKNRIIIEYCIIKVDLQIGERKRKITCDKAEYILKMDDFLEYRNYSISKRISLLHKWMSKRKQKINSNTFEPNLTILTG